MELSKIVDCIPTDVLSFVEDIQKRNYEFDVYIGGGYLRDIYTDNTPKDIDIFFVPKEGECKHAYYKPSQTYTNYHKGAIEISDMQDRGVFELTGLWAPRLSTSDIQYIVYQKPMTQYELCADMDMNICQILYNIGTKETSWTEAFYKGHKGTLIECLHKYDLKRTYFRYERMEDKFDYYDVVGKPTLEEAGIEEHEIESLRAEYEGSV